MERLQVGRWLMRATLRLHTAVIYRLARFLGPVAATPERFEWHFTTHGKTHPVKAWVIFTFAADRYSDLHVLLVLEHLGRFWVINPATRLWIAPLNNPDRYISAMKPVYVAQTELPKGALEGWMLSEPYSCVTLVRSVLGIFDPLIQTPEQLLSELWRKRDE